MHFGFDFNIHNPKMTTSTSTSTSHFKDLAIKLFGQTIPLPESQISTAATAAVAALQNLQDGCNNLKRAEQSVSGAEDSCPSERSTVVVGDNKENQASNVTTNKEELEPRSKEEQADRERVFKKPDKIIPCPRCNSLETKFCYFNNYNVNQPRHFCKNCQRYWTAGGTMRNVPIGAGRRRNKQLASQYRQIMVSSEGVATTRLETSDTTTNRVESPPGTVLKFGPEPMETVLSLGDQKRSIEIIGSAYCGDSPEEPSSCGSSMTTTSIRGNELPTTVVEREAVRLSGCSGEIAASNTVHCHPVPQMVFPLNNRSGNGLSPVQWLPATMLAVPGFCTPSLPLQFVPASCWGCTTPTWTSTGAGNLTDIASCPKSSSPTLGKHSRDANSIPEEEKSEKCGALSKTLHVDNPSEASRSTSPIWTTFRKEGHFRDAPHILEAKTGSFYSLL